MITDLKISLDCEPTRTTIEAKGPTLSVAVSQACSELSQRYSQLSKVVIGVRRIADQHEEDETAPFATIEPRCNLSDFESPFTLKNGLDFIRDAATLDDILVMIDVTDVYQRATARVLGINFPETLDESFEDEERDPQRCLKDFVAAAHGMMLWDNNIPPIDVRGELDRLWGSNDWTQILAPEQVQIAEVKIYSICVVGQYANGWMIRFDYTEGERIGREVEFVWRDRAGRYQVIRDERSALRTYDTAFLGGQLDQVHDALQRALDAGEYVEEFRVASQIRKSRSEKDSATIA
ncbi:hypothetical protein [Pararhizobium arenae]|uniref:hypothetical protein n=1 Tax=Pararhizobium arenae TaxID=1856850 RepID=UPI00094B268D|nr:hypothetical protein [Pararhizobium arenae]